jgi:hypothetical protein
MRFKITFLFLVLVMPCLALASFSPNAFQKMSKEQKLMTLASNPPIGDADQLLEVLMMGINDSDKDIQKEAMGKLAATMIGLQQYVQKHGEIPIDSENIAKAQLALRTQLSNPDDQLRGGAFMALAYSDAPNPDIESALLNQFAREPNEQLKAGIIETMGFAGYDSIRYIQILGESLLTPSSYDYISDAASTVIATLKPPGILPLLAQMLEKKRSLHWGTLAMAAYGAEAKPYLPLLEKLAADPTLAMRGEINNVIAAIQNPPPPPAATPRIKAVSLQSAAKPPTSATAQTTPVPAQQPKPTASPAPTVATKKQPSSSFPVVLVVILATVIAGAIVFFLRRKSPK